MTRGLAACCTPQLLIAADFSLLSVNGPALRAALALDEQGLAWVFSAYSLVFGALLLAGGRLADLADRIVLLRAGTALFAVGALLAATAPGFGLLLGARAVQGAGAAIMAPAALALLARRFTTGAARTRALAVYGVVVSVGFVAGSLAGGAVGAAAGWRWALALEVGLGVVATILARPLPGEARGRRERWGGGIDPRGVVIVGASVVAFTLALSGRVGAGLAGGLLAVSALCGVLATRVRGTTEPLVPRAVVGLAAVQAAALGAAALTATGTAAVILLSLGLQEVRGLSVLQTSWLFAVFGLPAVAGGALASGVAGRFGAGAVLSAGLSGQAAALAGLAAAGVDGPAIGILLGLAAFGAGHVVANAGIPMLALAGVPAPRQGTVSGPVSTLQFAGAAIGPLAAVTVARAHGDGAAVGAAAVDQGLLAAGGACAVAAGAVGVLLRRAGATRAATSL